MKASFNPQRSCNPHVENHCTSITYVGIPWFAMVIAVTALSLLPRRAQTLDMLAGFLDCFSGWEHSWGTWYTPEASAEYSHLGN